MDKLEISNFDESASRRHVSNDLRLGNNLFTFCLFGNENKSILFRSFIYWWIP